MWKKWATSKDINEKKEDIRYSKKHDIKEIKIKIRMATNNIKGYFRLDTFEATNQYQHKNRVK